MRIRLHIAPLLLCTLALPALAQDAGVRVFAQASGAVAWVETLSADSLHHLRSSGVVLKEQGWLLTCFHGFKNGGSIAARLGDVPLQLGAVITADEARDLVVVQVLGTEPASAWKSVPTLATVCLLYTSDAADERSSVDLGGRRIIKKKTQLTLRVHRIIHNTTAIITTSAPAH